MCPCQNGADQAATNAEMVQVPMNGATPIANGAATNGHTNGHTNGVNGHANGANGHTNGTQQQRPSNPYAPRASDFLSNVRNFKIIESTLRGECPAGVVTAVALYDYMYAGY